MFRETFSFLVFLRAKTTLKLHLKANRIGWYEDWHQTRHHKHIHVLVLAVYSFSIIAGVLNYPLEAEAAWNNMKTWSTKSDFETGAVLTDIAVSGDDDADDANNNDNLSLASQEEKRQTIAAGVSYSMAIKTNGTLWGTGYNESGSLGVGDAFYRNSWTQVPISNVVSVSASSHTLVLKSDGTVWGSGRNDLRQLGDGTANTSTSFVQAKTSATVPLTNIRKIFAAPNHSLAITNNNKLFVCGYNGYGQLGVGTKISPDLYFPYWREVTSFAGLSNFEVLDAGGGERTSMVLIKNLATGQNELYGAGRNEQGELGVGDNVEHLSWMLSPLTGVVSLSPGWWHNIAVVKNENNNYVPFSTGNGGSGRMGVGDTGNRSEWTATNIDDVYEVYAGVTSSFVFRRDGSVWGTGANSYGQLNTGDLTYRVLFTTTGFSEITSISVGSSDHVLYLKRNGDLFFAGVNMHSQLGNGENHYRNTPTQTNFSGPDIIGKGIYTSFGIKGGYLYSAGYNGYSSLGLTDGFNRDTFTKTAINNVTKVDSGDSHTIYLKNDGSVWGLGYNSYGQLGVGAGSSFATPQRAKIDATNFLTDVVDISTTRLHSLALKSDGTVWGTGYNYVCQVSLSGCVTPNTNNQIYWTQIGSNGRKIFTGANFSAILKTDGTLLTIGENGYGQLGVGNWSNQASWQTSNTAVLDAWSGPQNIFIRKDNGIINDGLDDIWVTGYNTSGQLGLGDYTNRNVWTKSVTLSSVGINTISLGYGHTFALKTDGTVLSTGYNYFGQLGHGDFVRDATWQPALISNVEQVSSGYYHTIFKKTDGTVWSTGYDAYGCLGLGVFPFKLSVVAASNNIKQPSPFLSPGTASSFKFNAGAVVNWVNMLWSAELPAGSTLRFRTRSASDEAGLASAQWSAYYSSSGDNITSSNSVWLEVEVLMESADGSTSPTVNSFSAIYYTDIEAPTNPSTVNAWKDNTKSNELLNNTWSNSDNFYAEWSGSTDLGGSDVKGYWVYFGPDPTADPKMVGDFQVGSTYESAVDPDDSGKTLYLSVSAEDNAGNRFSTSVEPYFKVFDYKYDKTMPNIDTANVVVAPVGWSVSDSFSFTWQDVDDPLSNGDASGVRGYQYKRKNGSDAWSVESTDKTIAGIQSYQNGQNIFELRAIDNAGNISNTKEISYYYNADAPTPPQNVTATPQSSTDNLFEFQWDAPLSANGGVKGYYYSVNATPSRFNSVYTTLNSTGPIPAATQQSFNTFYVVAMDSSDNINWGSYASVQFECNTPAPGIPNNPEIFDTSNRDLQKYSLALSWTEPTEKGAGFNGYIIERSENNNDFEQIGTSAGTSYLDTGIVSKPYYYRVLARDNSGNVSAASSVVSLTPTGKYTSAPSITANPEVATKVSTAIIGWVTDRSASSFVEIGESVNYGLTQGQFDFVTDHTVNIAGLKSDTVYHYRVKFVDEDGNIGYSNDNTLKTQPAPRVVGVEISEVKLDKAYISWRTTAPAQSTIKYGKNSNYSSLLANVSGGYTTSHAVMLTELDHSSTYHLAILIKDIDGNEVLSDDYSFDTQKYPIISLVRLEPVKGASSATISFTWKTNVPTGSIVSYSTEGGKFEEVVSSKLKTEHAITVSNLRDNTLYTAYMEGHDQFGNLAKSEAQSFKTDYDTRPPIVTNVTSESEVIGFGVDARGQIVVSWLTDEPSASQVEYGIGSTGAYTNKTQEESTNSTSHVVIVTDLKASSPYHFRVISKDESGNEGYSEDVITLTGQAASSVLDIILKTLTSSLGWLFNN